MKARIIGIETKMLTFNFLFGIALGTLILQHSDNLTKACSMILLQLAEGQQLAKLISSNPFVKKTFKSFYNRVLLHQSEFDIDAPTLSCKRHAPRRL